MRNSVSCLVSRIMQGCLRLRTLYYIVRVLWQHCCYCSIICSALCCRHTVRYLVRSTHSNTQYALQHAVRTPTRSTHSNTQYALQRAVRTPTRSTHSNMQYTLQRAVRTPTRSTHSQFDACGGVFTCNCIAFDFFYCILLVDSVDMYLQYWNTVLWQSYH